MHTKMVLHALNLILRWERCDKEILIPAAILHDTGWSAVPFSLQRARDKERVEKAMRLHLDCSVPIIKEILFAVNFDKNKTGKVIDIVLSHKFRNPRNLDKRVLIDADTLSDIFSESFYSDARLYKIDPAGFYQIRMKNMFYTGAAADIFRRELKKRAREINTKAVISTDYADFRR